ncbi:hypothetical protein [Marinobacter halophilus]|uniref:Lipoprotein n=1 Tax=Marinobacter halophilus TaxID=1323740 RepID=A0A2T1KJ14_9GAMM|nr:hypothetical protein [Marinobacter halophilus]PSF10134.1 hypothetical protein C7H08_01125 [Marinobacter halophilus]GGC68039.1 hypothetical protein GCM10011362_15690 [Marinobacter halophilus]
MTFRIGITLVTALVLVGCSDNSNRGGVQELNPRISVDFTTFVKNEIKQTADNREAVNINRLEFSFNDQDNEQAFNNLF